MLRKLLLSAMIATGAFTGFAMTANAQPPAIRNVPRNHHERVRFEVLYQQHGHWDCFGTFGDRTAAERAAGQLRHRGFQVRIELERGR